MIEAASTNIKNGTRALTNQIYIGHLSKGTDKETLAEHIGVSINSDQGKNLIYE